MLDHRAAVMSQENTALASRKFKDFRIWNSFEPVLRGGSEVNCRFPSPDSDNNSLINIGIRLEPNQGRGSPIRARARCSLSQRAGFSSDSGTLLASHSRALSSK